MMQHTAHKHFRQIRCHKSSHELSQGRPAINTSKSRFHAAQKLLRETGAIVMAKQYFVGVRSSTFTLGQVPHPQFQAVAAAEDAAASDNGQVSQLYP